MLKTIFLTSCLFIFFSPNLWAQQNSDKLRKEQAVIQKEIDELRQALSNTKLRTKASLGQLAAIQKKLELRRQAINNSDQQIDAIQISINQSGKIINRLTQELDTLKRQYQKSIVYSYKSKNNYDFLNFIFSAASFNDALKRIEYLKSYRLYREHQVAAIKNARLLLQEKIAGLRDSRKEKDETLQKQQKERQVFLEEKAEEDEVINKLKARESELLKALAIKSKTDKKLEAGINAAINRKLEKTPAVVIEKGSVLKEKSRYTFPVTSEILAASAIFEKNRGRLPWPIDKGVIKIHFGRYKIPGIQIYGANPGLTFETEAGASIRNVLDGDVYAVFDVEGKYGVIIEYGKYFITYGNLASVSVVKGQKVEAGQVLGAAATNEDDKGEIEFILMIIKEIIDPEPWLRKK